MLLKEKDGDVIGAIRQCIEELFYRDVAITPGLPAEVVKTRIDEFEEWWKGQRGQYE